MDNDRSIELEQNLRAAALHQRMAAANELAGYPATAAMPIFKRLLSEKDVGLRRLAVMGLSKHRSDESFVELQTILNSSGDPIIIADAADALFEFGDVAMPILQQLFDRSTQSAQWQIRQTVISLVLDTDRYDVILPLLTAALADESMVVRELSIIAFQQLLYSPCQAEALALLVKFASDPNWQMRWCAARCLHGSPETQARQAIALLQQDEDFRVIAAALEGVGVRDREVE
jgi:HEAT repeat protein